MLPSQLSWYTHWTLRWCALLAAAFPPIIKIYETSWLFRESSDPSTYDEWRDFFDTAPVMFSGIGLSDKTLLRLHLFIFPFMIAAALMWLAHLIPVRERWTRAPSRGSLILRKVLRRPIHFHPLLVTVGMPARVTVAEIIGVLIFLVINWLVFYTRLHRCLLRGSRKLTFLVDQESAASKATIPSWSWQACEIWALTIGIMAIINMGWYLFIPISKRSIFLEVAGISWERAIKYHRWIGYYTCWLSVVHGVMYIALFIGNNGDAAYDPDQNLLNQNLNPAGCPNDSCDDDQQLMLRRNWYGISALFLLLVLTVSSISYVRRKYFTFFYTMHHLFAVILVLLCLHYKSTIILVLPGISVYLIDKLLGQLAYVNTGDAADVSMASPEVLEVSVALSPSASYSAGQYVLINVPSASFWEWHPYSITSAPHEHHGKILTFHIKVLGDWTQKVYEEVRKNGSLRLRLDGFYGADLVSSLLDLPSKGLSFDNGMKFIILVGGGIGITPMISVATELLDKGTPAVTILWVVRSIDEFLIFREHLGSTASQHANLTVKVWITMSGATSTNHEGVVDEALKMGTATKFNPAKPLNSAKAFMPNRLVLSPACQAFVSMLAILTATSAFGLSQYIGTEGEWLTDSQRLFDLFLVIMSLLVLVTVAVLVVLIHAKITPSATTELQPVDLEVQSARLSDNPSSPAKESLAVVDSIELKETKEELPHSRTAGGAVSKMIEGRVGVRPDISTEFSIIENAYASQANVSGTNEGSPINIKVLVCGPEKLVENVNAQCNERKWHVMNEPAYDFIEEDWNW